MKTGLTVANPSSVIHSTSPSDPAGRAKAIPDVEARTGVHSPIESVRLSTVGGRQLPDAPRARSEVRPEIVERGRRLAADPAYPSLDVIRHISVRIVRSLGLADALG